MSFSPEPRPARATEDLFQVLDSVLEARSCAYVAGPLDSGRSHYERIAARDNHSDLRSINEGRLSAFAACLRKRVAYPVFDPGLLKIAAWSARDHGVFFLEVIRRYARECWFIDGWEYSTGATKEFVLCCTIETPRYDGTGQRLTVLDGIRLIRSAAECVRTLQRDGDKLVSRVEELRHIEAAMNRRS